jgi:hypothetical protein
MQSQITVSSQSLAGLKKDSSEELKNNNNEPSPSSSQIPKNLLEGIAK